MTNKEEQKWMDFISGMVFSGWYGTGGGYDTPANVTDGLCRIGIALDRVADAIEKLADVGRK